MLRFSVLACSVVALVCPCSNVFAGLSTARTPTEQADAAPGGQVVNGGFESADARHLGKSKSRSFQSVPGWQSTKGKWVAQTGPWYKVEPHTGKHYLRPSSVVGKRCELQQTVAMGRFGATSPRAVMATVWMRTGVGKDRTEFRLAVLGAGDVVLAEQTTGRRAEKAWTEHRLLVPVPTDATAVRIALHGQHKSGKITDAFFDDVRVEGVGPGFPSEFAELSGKELIEKYQATTNGVEQRRLQFALAGSDERAGKFLVGLYDKQTDAAARRELAALLLVSNSKVAGRRLRRVIEKGAAAERKAILANIGLATFDWQKLLARLARRQKKNSLTFLNPLARHGAIQELRGLAANGGKKLQMHVLMALRKGEFTPAQLRPITDPHLTASGDSDLRYESMRIIGRARGAKYLEVLEAVCKAESSMGRRGNFARWATEFDSMAAIKALLPLVLRRLTRVPGAFLEWAPKMAAQEVGDWMRNTALRHREVVLRRTAVASIKNHPRAGDAALLAKAAIDADPEVAVGAVINLASLSGGDVATSLLALVTGKNARVAASALHSLWQATSGSASTVATAAKLAGQSKHWQVRVAAMRLLRARHAIAQRDTFAANFEHPVRQVRAAAFQALSHARDKKTIELLLARVDLERSTTRAFLVQTLVELTGVDKGDNGRLWLDWWNIVKADFIPPDKNAKRRKRTAGSGTVAKFYDIPLSTDRVVFIVDLSGSMRDRVKKGPDKGKTRLAVAKVRLIRALKAMIGGGRSFNIIAFSTEPRSYEKALADATEDNVKTAMRWVRNLKSGGWTNIYDSLEMALEMPGVESVFLLSDGAPSVGQIVNMTKIRAAVKARNKDLLIRINTISVGGSKESRKFMKQLAEANFGKNSDQH